MSSTSNLRKRLDSLIQSAKQIKYSQETTFAWRSLQMGKAWLGKALGYQGNASPYKPAASVGEIPPTADVANGPMLMDPYDHLANVNTMRDAIQSEIDSIEGTAPSEPNQAHCYRMALVHLTEAKMWYGFELQEIRESAKSELGTVVGGFLSENPAIADKIVENHPEIEGTVAGVISSAVIQEAQAASTGVEAEPAEPVASSGKKKDKKGK